MKKPLFSAIVFAVAMLVALSSQAGQNTDQAADAAPAPESADEVRASRIVIPVTTVDGVEIEELSGLAWSEDDQLLYAVSDQGDWFQFRLQIDGDDIVAVTPVSAGALSDPDGKAVQYQPFNAEGLAVRDADNGKPGDSVLVVALEGDRQPGILRVDADGQVLGVLPVPSPVNDYRNYRNYRKRSRGLESVTLTPDYGLMTAPESPLTQSDVHTLYVSGRHWSFPRYAPDNRLKGMAALADGNVLVLERSELDASGDRTATVRRVNVADCAEGGLCEVTDLAVLPAGPDNFEGIAQLDSTHFLIVSDQGGEGDQATVLILLTLSAS